MSVINGVNTAIAGRLTPDDGLLVSMAEHFDQFLLDWQMKHPMVWRDRLPMGTFPSFSGLSQKSYIFRGTLGPQAGLSGWTKIEQSQKPAGQDAGYDACAYNPQTYTWAYDAIDFSGLKTSWRSPIFCVRDLAMQDKAAQQLAFIVKAGAQITDQIKETFNREVYVKTVANAGKFVVLCEGAGLDFLSAAATRVTYDPFVVDADGDTYITFDADLLPKLSTLNWTQLDLIRQYLADQCPDAAQGNDSGMPMFGLMLDLMDFERFVLTDDKVREDMRYAKPQQLITGFNMGFKSYRGYILMHDLRQMRFNVDHVTGALGVAGTAVCKRVLPRKATRPGIIGYVPESNPDYVTAQLGTAVVFLNEVIQILVPSTINSLGSGMTFGPAPDFSGQWTWLNILDPESNPVGEIGYFFSRYEYHVKALQYAQDAIVILYKRCVETLKTGCLADVESTAKTTTGIAADAAAGDFSAANHTFDLTLNSRLTVGVGGAVTVKKAGGTSFTAYVLQSDGTAWRFGWVDGATNEPTANTDFTAAVTTVTVV